MRVHVRRQWTSYANRVAAHWRFRDSRVAETKVVLQHWTSCDSGGSRTGEDAGKGDSPDTIAIKVLVKKKQCGQPVMSMADIVRIINNPNVI